MFLSGKLQNGLNDMTEQILFSLPLDRLEPIFKKWFNDVLISQAPTTPTPSAHPDPIRLVGDRAGANYLGCSIMTIQHLRRSGAVSYYRMGRKVYYLSNELDAALKVQARKFQKSK